MKKGFAQSIAAPAEQDASTFNVPHLACYTTAQIIALLQISKRGFFRMRKRGQLPFLSALRPRLGRTVRYRADLVDRYLAGRWEHKRPFRRSA